MEHFLYILFSNSKNSFYIGESHNVEERLIKHNTHVYNPKSFTKITNDWEIALKFTCKSKDEALFLERYIKQMKSKKFILKIINNQDILTDILKKR